VIYFSSEQRGQRIAGFCDHQIVGMYANLVSDSQNVHLPLVISHGSFPLTNVRIITVPIFLSV
jgi:hypothetical protein